MKHRNIAVLLTCHNRKVKTLTCLSSLYNANIPPGYMLDIFLTDDGSTDGTAEAVMLLFPGVRMVRGDGKLFWAGGMRLAWETAMEEKSYDAYLLINDDVKLYSGFFNNLLKAEAYSISVTGKVGIYSGATVDEKTGVVSYGGYRVKDKKIVVRMHILTPGEQPQKCDLVNANVLWISKEVVDRIGIFDYHFTHGIADYDYSLQALKRSIPIFLAPNVCGVCNDDHGKNRLSCTIPLKERIAYMKSPKGLAYDEYIYYIRKHFPMFLPYSFIMLWMKTLFPFLWDYFKK